MCLCKNPYCCTVRSETHDAIYGNLTTRYYIPPIERQIVRLTEADTHNVASQQALVNIQGSLTVSTAPFIVLAAVSQLIVWATVSHQSCLCAKKANIMRTPGRTGAGAWRQRRPAWTLCSARLAWRFATLMLAFRYRAAKARLALHRGGELRHFYQRAYFQT